MLFPEFSPKFRPWKSSLRWTAGNVFANKAAIAAKILYGLVVAIMGVFKNRKKQTQSY